MSKNSENKSVLKKLILVFIAIFYITFIIALSFGSLAAGILTLIPADASKANHLGYYSVCSFTPFSTIILAVISIAGFILFIKMGHFLKTKYQNSNLIK